MGIAILLFCLVFILREVLMKVLYLTYENVFTTGILQAQVVPLLVLLKREGIESMLFSVNKQGEENAGIYKSNRVEFERLDIDLFEFNKTIGKKQSLWRFFVDLIPMVFAAYKLSNKVSVIHARSYGAAVIALICAFLSGRPYIFDMRGVLPEEILRVGKVKENSVKFRLIKLVENILVSRAKYVFTVSDVFSEYVKNEFGCKNVFNISNPVVLRDSEKRKIARDRVNFVYSGSAQPWHLVYETLRVFQYIYCTNPLKYKLYICSADIQEFQKYINQIGLPVESYELMTKSYVEMEAFLPTVDVGFCLREPSFESSVSCPVKFAEYVSNNIFVVTNKGVGDLEQFVGGDFAGVVFDESQLSSPEEMGKQIIQVLEGVEYIDNNLRGTCFDWGRQYVTVARIYRELSVI